MVWIDDQQFVVSVSWLDIFNRIPNMSMEELPEYLVHEDRLIRAKARVRLQALIREKSKVVT